MSTLKIALLSSPEFGKENLGFLTLDAQKCKDLDKIVDQWIAGVSIEKVLAQSKYFILLDKKF